MAKLSLDELRKGAPAALPERTYELCLRGDLLAKIQRLVADLQDAEVESGSDNAPPLRVGEQTRSQEIRAEIAGVYAEMDDSTGDLLLRAIPDGEWRRWVNEHPAREGDKRDEDVAWGICNADDLANDLHKWTAEWNGDPLGADDWARHIAPSVSGGDLKGLVATVVQMQEGREDPKLLRRVLLAGQTNNATDS